MTSTRGKNLSGSNSVITYLDVKLDWHGDAITDSDIDLRLGSHNSADQTKFLSKYSRYIRWRNLTVIQDDDTSGGETYTIKLYKNAVLERTITLLSPAKDTPLNVDISPVWKTNYEDIISVKFQTSQNLAGDEVMVTLWGRYNI